MKTSPLFFKILLGICLTLPVELGCGQAANSTAVSGGVEVRLPPPQVDGKMTLEEALARRRSIRKFSATDLSLEQVGQIAWAAQGITHQMRGFRTAPSAGALYPLEVYIVKRDGIFHYMPQGHRMLQISKEDARKALSKAALGQESIEEVPVDFVITAVYERTRVKYGNRAERYVHIEAGHAGQNIHLQAVTLGLGSVSVGAFDDRAVSKVLDLPANERPLYIIPVGHAR